LLYYAGAPGGKGVGSISYDLQANHAHHYKKLYLDFDYKWSTNWVNHEVGTKMFYLKDTLAQYRAPVFFIATSPNSDRYADMSFAAFFQACPDGSGGITNYNLFSNQGSVPLARNAWYRFQIILQYNTVGNADGALHVWINGTKTHQYTNLRIRDDGTGIDLMLLDGVYGGGTQNSVPADQYIYIDHWYTSGQVT